MTNVDWRKSYHLREWAWATACEFVDEQVAIEEAWLYYDATQLSKGLIFRPYINLQVIKFYADRMSTLVPRDLISKDLLK